MGNSLQYYQNRDAGLSPDHIRDHIAASTGVNWRGVALDIGTGAGGWMRYLVQSKKFERIIGADILDCRDEDNKKYEFHVLDLAKQKIPLPDNSIDYLFAIEVLEHIENPRFLIREIFRVLKPGGSFIMSTPSCDSLTSKISFLVRGYFPPFCEHDYVGSGHITPITSLDFKRMTKEAGFSKVEEDFALPGRLPGMKIFWQTIFPFLKGKNWCDCFIASCTK